MIAIGEGVRICLVANAALGRRLTGLESVVCSEVPVGTELGTSVLVVDRQHYELAVDHAVADAVREPNGIDAPFCDLPFSKRVKDDWGLHTD